MNLRHTVRATIRSKERIKSAENWKLERNVSAKMEAGGSSPLGISDELGAEELKSSSWLRRAETQVDMFISYGSAAALSDRVGWQALAFWSESSCSIPKLPPPKVSATRAFAVLGQRCLGPSVPIRPTDR